MNIVIESAHQGLFDAQFAIEYAAFALAQKGQPLHITNVPFRHPLPNFPARPLSRAFFWPAWRALPLNQAYPTVSGSLANCIGARANLASSLLTIVEEGGEGILNGRCGYSSR